MARDRKAEAARRDAAARARGFTSYGQEYRARKSGFRGSGDEWNNKLEAARDGVAKRAADVELQGYTGSRAGRVISARHEVKGQPEDWGGWRTSPPESMRQMGRSIGATDKDKRLQMTLSPDGRPSRTIGEFGGTRIGDIYAAGGMWGSFLAYVEWATSIYGKSEGLPPNWYGVVTVVIR